MSTPTRYGAGDHEQTHREAPKTAESSGWKPFKPSESGPESRVKSDYGYGRLEPGDSPPAMQEERNFWSRTSDEIRSWFGDRHAEERRTADLARAHGFDPTTRDPHDDEDDVVWHGERNLPPPR